MNSGESPFTMSFSLICCSDSNFAKRRRLVVEFDGGGDGFYLLAQLLLFVTIKMGQKTEGVDTD